MEKIFRVGSGFFIEIDRIVTNRHVIEGAYRAEIHSSTGTVYPVKGVIAVDAEGDLAVLKIDAPATYIRPLPLDKTSPQEGESVVVIGCACGAEGSVTNGIVSAVRRYSDVDRIIQITLLYLRAHGSAVVNMHGQVIGIATLQITGGQSVNFAIPSERIAQLRIAAPMSLSELVVASGRNKRAKAVQYFRDGGFSFLSKDDCEKALVSFEKAVESDSNYAEAWAQSGFCNEKLGKHAEALEASRRAVNLRPSAESYFNIGLANFYLKQYKEAVDGYRQAIKLDPYNSADAYYALALVYRDWGKPDEEIQSYKQAIRLRPDYILAYERLGTRYLRSKKFAEAVEIFSPDRDSKAGRFRRRQIIWEKRISN